MQFELRMGHVKYKGTESSQSAVTINSADNIDKGRGRTRVEKQKTEKQQRAGDQG